MNDHSEIPDNAIVGGRDANGDTIYVGRSFQYGHEISHEAISSENIVYFPNEKSHYEVNPKIYRIKFNTM